MLADALNFHGFKPKKALFTAFKDISPRGAYCRAKFSAGIVQTACMLYAATRPQFSAVFACLLAPCAVLEVVVLEVGLRRLRK